ncbi:MAG: hypothetical protein IPK99_00540 [Flavobacteriales bacterium]|nr:hypothetical protein [Flavobacteriales bacterium]
MRQTRTILLMANLACASALFAQEPFCGSDLLREKDLTTAGREAEAALYARIAAHAKGRDRGGILTVPVVFHVLHDNGPEDVPLSGIQQAVTEVNTRLMNLAPWDDSTGHAVNIQLCLCVGRSFGQPTDGVTRHQTGLTEHAMAQQLSVKGTERWDPYRYLNIWIVRSVADQGIDGYSSFPGDLGTATDGLVMEAQYLLNNHLMSHELGHYFGLFHTFQGYCLNLNCLLDGDRICDTPPDYTFYFTCNDFNCSSETQDTTGLSPFTMDVPALPNYMDYTTCPLSFSQDQADRMYDMAAMVRADLLSSYACGGAPSGAEPVASCVVDSSECTGRVTFTSTSLNAPFVQWDIDNDGWDHVGTAFTSDFITGGDHPVTLLAGGPGGTDTIQFTLHVRVAPTPQYPILSGFEGIFADINTGAPTICYGTSLELVADVGMTSYQWTTSETTGSIDVIADSSFAIRLTATDANGLAWTNCTWIQAGVMPPPQIISSAGDTIHCGQFVQLSLDPATTADWYWGCCIEASNASTYEPSSNLLYPRSYWARRFDANGCLLVTDTFTLITLPTIPPVITQVGNDLVLDTGCSNLNWYAQGLDLSQFAGQTVVPDAVPGCYWVFCSDCGPVYSDTLCLLPTDVGSLRQENGYQLYPVPVQDRLWILPAPSADVNAELMDASGRIIQRLVSSDLGHGFSVTLLPAGLYALRMRDGRDARVLRFVKE